MIAEAFEQRSKAPAKPIGDLGKGSKFTRVALRKLFASEDIGKRSRAFDCIQSGDPDGGFPRG